MSVSAMLYLHTLSPLHSGTGQGSGFIDLPVSRNATTNWPEIPGSSVKGSLRTACKEAGITDNVLTRLFGIDISTDGNDAREGAGHLWSASARLLCYPVRSFKGTFAWITCPLALRAWLRDYATAGQVINLTFPQNVAEDKLLCTTDSRASLGVFVQNVPAKVLLEDLDLLLDTTQMAALDAIASRIAGAVFTETAWINYFKERFALVSDDVFTFLVTTTTPVTAHIRISDETKTVAGGALWYEETIPAEAIFTLPLVDRPGNLIDQFAPGIERAFQLGGNASVGQGLIRAVLDPQPQAPAPAAAAMENES